jgi:TrkA family protein
VTNSDTVNLEFAAAMLEHQVLRTIPVGRHVLLIADIRVGAGSDLDGRAVEDAHQASQVRMIAHRRPGADQINWSPAPRLVLSPQDEIYVLATRAGLSRAIARARWTDSDVWYGPVRPGMSKPGSPRTRVSRVTFRAGLPLGSHELSVKTEEGPVGPPCTHILPR